MLQGAAKKMPLALPQGREDEQFQTLDRSQGKTETERQLSYDEQSQQQSLRKKMCSCGKICKNSRGLKIHHEKTRCQTPEKKLVTPPQKNVLYPCKMLFYDHVSFLMMVSTIEHLTVPLFLSQVVRSQLLVTNAMYKQKT